MFDPLKINIQSEYSMKSLSWNSFFGFVSTLVVNDSVYEASFPFKNLLNIRVLFSDFFS